MKEKLFFILIGVFVSIVNVKAEDYILNALRLTLKKGDTKEVLFTENPQISHKDDGTVIIIVGTTKNEYILSEIEKMTFFFNDGSNAILNVFSDGSKIDQHGIYTIKGVRVDNIDKHGIYIINGKKVLVK